MELFETCSVVSHALQLMVEFSTVLISSQPTMSHYRRVPIKSEKKNQSKILPIAVESFLVTIMTMPLMGQDVYEVYEWHIETAEI